jgi:hypothetical protein
VLSISAFWLLKSWVHVTVCRIWWPLTGGKPADALGVIGMTNGRPSPGKTARLSRKRESENALPSRLTSCKPGHAPEFMTGTDRS